MKHCVITGEPTNLDPRTKTSHHATTIVLGTGIEVEDRDLDHQGATTAHGREEAEDPNPRDMHTIMTTMK
jgi:hypothetical protein